MRAKARPGRRGAVSAPVFLSAFLMLAVLLWGAGEEGRGAGTAVAEIPEGGCGVLLFTEAGEHTWLAYSGIRDSAVLALDTATGTEEYRADFPGPLTWAAPRGGSLFVCGEASGSLLVTKLSPRLEKEGEYLYAENFSGLAFFDCSPQGGVYLVRNGANNTVTMASPEGGETARSFSGEIRFLEAAPSGRLYLLAGRELYCSEDGSLEALFQVACQAAPVLLLGEDVFLDEDGMACRVRDGEALPLLRCPMPLGGPLLYCLESENGLILGDGGKKVLRIPWNASKAESYSIEGSLFAVAAGGALSQWEGAFWYWPHGFAGTGPSPSPGESPSPPPGGLPGWKPAVQGEYLTVPVGATVEELVLLFQPEPVTVQSPSGERVASGKLATGMTAERYTLVVPGDCNGTGTVNGADLRAVQAHVLEEADLGGGAYFLAADLDGDGAITAADLVLLGAAALF